MNSFKVGDEVVIKQGIHLLPIVYISQVGIIDMINPEYKFGYRVKLKSTTDRFSKDELELFTEFEIEYI